MLKACQHCGRVHARDFDCGRKPVRTKYNRKDSELGRYSWEFSKKSREIKERSLYLCAVCADKGNFRPQVIETHHIAKLRDRPELLISDENLVCLCVEHHKKADRGELDARYLCQLAARRDAGIPPGVETAFMI